MDKNLEAALTFAILMEGHGGIKGKSAGYVLEKWEAVRSWDHPHRMLDKANLRKLKEWCKDWHQELTGEV